MHYDMYVGTNSVRGSEGVYHIELDGATGEMTCRDIIPFYNSGYLLRSGDGRRLYVVGEGMTFRGAASGGAVAYDLTGGAPREIGAQLTQGQRPCQAALSADGKTLYVGNFFGGTIAVLPVNECGGLEPAVRVICHQRTPVFRAAIHCVTPHPQGTCLAAIELAHNAINLYDPAEDYRMVYSLELPDGTFPRHMEFSEDGRFLYLLSQELSRVFVYAYLPDQPQQLQELQQISTLPEGFRGRNEAAAIRLHPNGRILITSNRGVGEGERMDSLAVFLRREDTGQLTLARICPTRGRTPRDFQFTPDGAWLVAALQASDTLESYRVDGATGELTLGAADFAVPSPACVAR